MIRTMVDWFRQRVEKDGRRTALLVKRQGQFQPVSWGELYEDARRLALALLQRHVGPGERVAHWSENRYEWIVTDLALMMIGAVHVPIHATLTGTQAAYQIRHSQARCVVISTAELAAKLAAVIDQLPPNLTCICWDAAVERLGELPVEYGPRIMEQASSGNLGIYEGSGEDLATILYTSGTTGEPKGVMLSQRNLVSNVEAVLAVLPQHQEEVRLCFLPLSHIFARTCDLYTWLAGGLVLALAESRTSVIADAQAVRPTLLNAVPYFYERVYRGLHEAHIADHSDAVKQLLGGRIRLLCGGGAALPTYLFDYFDGQGCPILQGYGLTETSPVISISTPQAYRRGASGRPIPGVEVRVADDGEILTRGPHVMMGYYRDPRATEAVIRDGWFYTGDYGKIDEDGFLYITGRKKEIIVTLGGKNIAPVLLESLLTEDPLIQQAMVVGDDRKFLAALIVPDFAQLDQWVRSQGIAQAFTHDHLKDARVRAEFAARIRQRLSSLSHYEQVARFILLPRAFSIENEEVTPKLSLRRDVIARHFAQEIEWLYSEDYTRDVSESESVIDRQL